MLPNAALAIPQKEREEKRVGERRKKSEMASIAKNVLKSVREKGFSAFFRELKDEGYLFVPFLFFASK